MLYGMAIPNDFIPYGSRTAMSNAERQRDFRRRNPDYYRIVHAKRRAKVKAYRAAMLAAAQEQVVVTRREPLMLPAPVKQILIPGMNAIPAMMPVREAVQVISRS
jgi:hypothetical protein